MVNTIRKVFEQTSWQVIGKAITSISTIAILALVSRNYGESGTGIFTLALTFLAFFTLAVDFGVNAYILPKLLEEGFEQEWRKIFGIRLVLAALFIFIALTVALIFPFDTVFKTLVILGAFPFIVGQAVLITSNAIFQAKLRYDLSVLAWGTGSLTTLAAVFFIAAQKLELIALILGYVIGWFVMIITSLLFIRKFVKNLVPIFNFTYFKEILKNSWPISATLVLNVIYFRLDAFILSYFRSFAEVGVYNLSYSIFQSALVLPTFIMNGFYPIMLKNFSENINKFRSNLFYAGGIMFTIAVIGILFTYAFSPFVVNLVTGGRGFEGSVESLRILSFGFPAYFVSAVLMWTLIVYKRYKTLLSIYLIGLLFNVIANVIFIPQYSYFGASWITAASEYLILGLQLAILLPLLRIR